MQEMPSDPVSAKTATPPQNLASLQEKSCVAAKTCNEKDLEQYDDKFSGKRNKLVTDSNTTSSSFSSRSNTSLGKSLNKKRRCSSSRLILTLSCVVLIAVVIAIAAIAAVAFSDDPTITTSTASDASQTAFPTVPSSPLASPPVSPSPVASTGVTLVPSLDSSSFSPWTTISEALSSSPSRSFPPTLPLDRESMKRIIRDEMVSLLPSSNLYGRAQPSGSFLPFEKPDTPQFCALQWLMNHTTPERPTTRIALLESYALLVLHFSQLQVSHPHNCSEILPNNANFLGISPTKNVCLWNKDALAFENVIPTCDKSGRRQTLRMKYDQVNTFPEELVLLQGLSTIFCNSNQGLETIPWDAVEQWSKMTFMEMTGNSLRGEFPARLFRFGDVVDDNDDDRKLPLFLLDVSGNSLGGTFPHVIDAERLESLEILSAHSQQIAGTLPATIDHLERLRRLKLQGNAIHGPLPTQLGKLKEIEWLCLSDNQFSGPLPTELGMLSKITEISASNNNLNGTIPTELGGIKTLQKLHLAGNNLHGSIPTELGGLKQSKLESVDLSSNVLAGTIPTELGKLTRAVFLDLSNNRLEGGVPMELAKMKRLRELRLWNNLLNASMEEFCAVKSGKLVVSVECQNERFDIPCSCCKKCA